MNSYAKGARLERKALHALEAEGYVCTRSAGSHGVWDITAVRGVEPVLLIQVKANLSEAAAMKVLKMMRKRFHQWAPIEVQVWTYLDGYEEPYIYP